MAATVTHTPQTHATAGKGWNIGLWIGQVVLALMFGMAGFLKSTQPIEELGKNMTWVSDVPASLVRFIGVAEIAGALGLVVPAATPVAPRL